MTTSFATLRSTSFHRGTRVSARGFAGFTMQPGTSAAYGDVAVPDDLAQLGVFQGLQRAVNQYRQTFGLSTQGVAVDGEIGNLTRAAYNEAASHARQLSDPSISVYGTNNSLAMDAETAARTLAAAGGFTADFTPDPRKATPRYKGPREDVLTPQSPPIGGGRSKLGLALAGGALIGLIWYAASDRR